MEGLSPHRQDIHDILFRLQRMERRFENTDRQGKVSEVKYDKEKKRWYAKLKDDGGDGKPFDSDWLPWKSFSHGAISFSVPPRVGQDVSMRSPAGYPEQAYMEAYHYGPDTPSPHDKEDEVVMQIVKPKKKDEGSSQTSGSSSSSSASSGSSSSQSSETEEQDPPALRIRATNGGYVLTVGQLGSSKEASASDGDGASKGEKNTFQMTIGRDQQVITCGKFKGVVGKDGAKLTWGDKVGFELKDGQIEQFVDGAKQTLTKDNIVSKLGQSSHTLSDGLFQVAGGAIKHDDRNIGKGHVHSGVMTGGSKTQQPDP